MKALGVLSVAMALVLSACGGAGQDSAGQGADASAPADVGDTSPTTNADATSSLPLPIDCPLSFHINGVHLVQSTRTVGGDSYACAVCFSYQSNDFPVGGCLFDFQVTQSVSRVLCVTGDFAASGCI